MTLESDAKFEVILALGFKNYMTSLVSFNVSRNSSENLHFDVLLLSTTLKFQPKMCWRVISHDTEEWSKRWRKTNFLLKNNMRNLMNFNSNSEKPENLNFDVIFLSKVCNVWAKIIQTNCVVKSDLWYKKGIRNLVNFHASWKKF